MISKTVIFILSSFHVRCIKRIKEFVEHGYHVEVYGFSRNETFVDIEAQVIGVFTPDSSHIKRIPVIIKGIKSVLDSIKGRDVVVYVFGLDLAMWFALLNHKHPYIFEESDLYHTYVGNKFVRNFLERVDKRVINKSLLTVFTSEGFARYHFGENIPDNVSFITNRLEDTVLDCKPVVKKKVDINHLSIGFVGAIRFKSVMHFADFFVRHYPQHEFHFYGVVTSEAQAQFDELMKEPNCFYHGKFTTPTDLPGIYSNIDLVLSTYDSEYINVKYAEPNKFYESLYFETPIIVSDGTFLGEKVRRFNSGYVIDAMNDASIKSFVDGLTADDIADKTNSIKAVPKNDSVNINDLFFRKLEEL